MRRRSTSGTGAVRAAPSPARWRRSGCCSGSDTIPSRVNYGGGYSYRETQIRGFSLTHLSGTGCPIMEDVPFLPTTVPVASSPALPRSYDVAPAHVPTFSHRGERAEPGYYRVWLDRGTEREVGVELAATTRAGLGRFRFAPTATASVLVNAGGSAMANGDAVFAIDPARRTVSGWVESGQFCYHRQRYRAFFVAEFDRPFVQYGTWTKQTLVAGATAAATTPSSPSSSGRCPRCRTRAARATARRRARTSRSMPGTTGPSGCASASRSSTWTARARTSPPSCRRGRSRRSGGAHAQHGATCWAGSRSAAASAPTAGRSTRCSTTRCSVPPS